MPADDTACADKVTWLVDSAAAPHHNLLVLQGKDDIFVGGKFFSHAAGAM